MSVPLLVLVYTRGGYVYIVIPEHRHTGIHHALGKHVLAEVDVHLVKSPVGEPVDQLGLAALRVPNHHHRHPGHAHPARVTLVCLKILSQTL